MNDGLADAVSNSLLPRLAGSALRWWRGVPALPGAAPVWPLIGTPAAIGASDGLRSAEPIRRLLPPMAAGVGALTWRRRAALEGWIAAIPLAHRAELDAIIGASGAPAAQVLRSNVIVETACSVLAALPADGRPLVIARNMDFFPAGLTGPATVVKSYHPAGALAFTSVSWPGYAGVVSGMNEDGVVACVLLNHHGPAAGPGTPICFRMREILETCRDLSAAMARFAVAPTASSHYVLLADAASAAVLWWEGERLRRADPEQGILLIDNGRRDAAGRPLGRRARHLGDLARDRTVDAATARSLATATCQRGTNAQAMVFVPAERRLQLACGDDWRPAAWQAWWDYAGDAPIPLGRAERLPHFLG